MKYEKTIQLTKSICKLEEIELDLRSLSHYADLFNISSNLTYELNTLANRIDQERYNLESLIDKFIDE